jgi:hypothetical protein
MPNKIVDVISGIEDTAPTTHKPRPNPRDRPMYGRTGVTMGQHLDEFAEYKNSIGRSFDQLVYSTLHRRGTRLIVEAPLLQTGNATSR